MTGRPSKTVGELRRMVVEVNNTLIITFEYTNFYIRIFEYMGLIESDHFLR